MKISNQASLPLLAAAFLIMIVFNLTVTNMIWNMRKIVQGAEAKTADLGHRLEAVEAILSKDPSGSVKVDTGLLAHGQQPESVKRHELPAHEKTDDKKAVHLSPAQQDSKGGDQPVAFRKGKCLNPLPAKPPQFSSASDFCLGAPVTSDPMVVAAVIFVRIYATDRAKLTKLDLAHWLVYYRYAGIGKVYLYDAWELDGERLKHFPPVAEAIASGFVEYFDYHDRAAVPKKKGGFTVVKNVANPARNDATKRAQGVARWLICMDLDEYPWVNDDVKPGFFARWLTKLEADEETLKPCSRTTQVLLQNMLVKGERGDTTRGPMLIQQVPRLARVPSNKLVKQITRVDAVADHGVHHSQMAFGRNLEVNFKDAMMKHFWAGRAELKHRRVEELPEDVREKLFQETVENSMGGIPEQLLACPTFKNAGGDNGGRLDPG